MFKFGNLLSLPDLQSWFRWQNCSLPLPRTRIPNPEILRSKHEDAARVKRSAPCAVGQWALLQEVTIGTGLNVPWSDIHIIVPIRSWNLVNSPWVISNWFRHRPETKKQTECMENIVKNLPNAETLWASQVDHLASASARLSHIREAAMWRADSVSHIGENQVRARILAIHFTANETIK